MTRNVTLSITAVVVVVTIVVLVNVFFGPQNNIMKSSSYSKELSAKASLPPPSSFRLIQTIPKLHIQGFDTLFFVFVKEFLNFVNTQICIAWVRPSLFIKKSQ
jgi:hypothetical protein